MYIPNQHYQLIRPDTTHNYSFANPKHKNRHSQIEQACITVDQEKALAMWLITVLQPHSDSFIKVLRKLGQVRTIDWDRLIGINYPQYSKIVRYYIIAALMDYQMINESDTMAQEWSDDIKIVIEQLASRYYRQYEWLVKFIHIPVYTIFPLFDIYFRGNINYLQLITYARTKLTTLQSFKDLTEQSADLINLKLTNNISGESLLITQQNIDQLLLRCRSAMFTPNVCQKYDNLADSERYLKIRQILIMEESKQNQAIQSNRFSNLMRSRKQLDQLQMVKQQLQIKQLSEQKAKKIQLQTCKVPYYQQKLTHRSQPQAYRHYMSYEPETASNITYNPSTPSDYQKLRQTRANLQQSDSKLKNKQKIDDVQKYKSNHLYTFQNSIKQQEQHRSIINQAKQNCPNHNSFQQQKQIQQVILLQSQKRKAQQQFQSAILTQLQLIRFQKSQAHRKFLNYI